MNTLELALELQTRIKGIVAQEKRRAKMLEKSANMSIDTATQRQIGKLNADLTWSAMDLDKSKHDLHAVCVDYGLAAPREDYDDIEYNPSAFHKYNFKPRKPKCRQ